MTPNRKVMIDPNDVYHIYPKLDKENHCFDCDYPENGMPYSLCNCKPYFKEDGSSLWIVHRPFDMIVHEDMICPITKEHCDDECCPVGSICNLSAYDPSQTNTTN